MHELSIAMSILDMAQEESARLGARIEAIHLKLGSLSGIEPDALASAYELAREQTEFSDCRLVVEEVPVRIFCTHCNAERPIKSLQWFHCAECDTPGNQVVQGRELLVSALEVAA